eukprot:365069-Chlamydomonas_euryale.AAC.2
MHFATSEVFYAHITRKVHALYPGLGLWLNQQPCAPARHCWADTFRHHSRLKFAALSGHLQQAHRVSVERRATQGITAWKQ